MVTFQWLVTIQNTLWIETSDLTKFKFSKINNAKLNSVTNLVELVKLKLVTGKYHNFLVLSNKLL